MTYLLVEDAASWLATAIRPYIRKKKQFRSTMKDLLNDTFSRCLYPNSIYNGNKAAANLRPNGPAGGIAADGNADARCPSLESGLQRKLELYHALIPRPACRAA